jgi:STE24 endopeptidase
MNTDEPRWTQVASSFILCLSSGERGLEAPDPERQAQARRYARLRRRLIPVSLGLGLAWLLAWLFSGAAVALRQALSDLTGSRALVVTLFSGVLGGGYALLDLPLSYYGGFVLPHRFGLSTQSLGDWIVDQLKGALVGGTLGLLMVQGLYLALTAWPNAWWLPLGIVYLFFSVALSALAPVLIVPLFFKFTPLEEEHQPLVDRLTALAEQAGTRVRGVYRIDMSRRTRAANAGLMGMGRSRRIVLGDTLLAEFTSDEIETILAHELAHQVHHDLPLGILAQSLITLVGLWLASLALTWGAGRLGLDHAAGERLVSLAGAPGRPLCYTSHRRAAGLCLGIGAPGRPEPGRGRTGSLGRVSALQPPARGQTDFGSSCCRPAR